MAAITATADAEARAFLGKLSEQERRAHRPTVADRALAGRRRSLNFYAGFGFPSDQLTGSGMGGFDAGRVTRLTDGWAPQQVGPNRMTALGGHFMRNRARDLVANNPYAFAGVVKFLNNVVGCGTDPKPQFADREARALWVAHWQRYCGHTAHATRECDITGDQPFSELMGLWLIEVITAGGCLAHFQELPRRGRSIPLAVELIPEERFADHVHRSGPNAKTANPIEQGIEFDAATGAPVAYHVLPYIPNDTSPLDIEPIRIPAENAEYGFFKRRIGQRRGWTLLAAAIQWLHALGYYTDSELYASDAKASWAYMINTGDVGTDVEWQGLFDSAPESGTVDMHGNRIEKIEPGMIWRGFPGDEIKAVGPNVPGSDSLPWIELIQRSIAAGIEQSYEEVTGDYSKGNMASVRMAAESVRKGYRRLHRHLLHHFANPVYRRWAEHSVRAGLDGFPRPSEFLSERDEWLRVKWSQPAWSSPNPVHDAQAAKIRKEQGLASDRDLVEEHGGDVDELYDELEFEQAEKERRGLIAMDPEPLDDEQTQALIDEEDRDDDEGAFDA